MIGGAGGSRITTGITFSIIKHLFMNETLTNSINEKRLHHQLAPMELNYETGFESAIVEELSLKYGHVMVENKPDGGFSAVVAISKSDGGIEAVVDPRRGGGIETF